MEKELIEAISSIHDPGGWVHLSTSGINGEPHVTPMMMGMSDEALLFSLTGKQKKLNLQRDSRACVAISKPVVMDHVIVWGSIKLHHDDRAQQIWNEMIRNAFGQERLDQISRKLSFEQTSLGLMTPKRYRIYGIKN